MICKVCSPGYVGSNCTQICPYPNYGLDCQGKCECDERLCDITTGCYAESVGCRQGYFGDRCVYRCRFPNYGKYCQHKCQCKESECSHVTGCGENQVTFNISVTNSLNKDKISTEVSMLVIVLSIALTFVVILAAVIIFVFCRRQKSTSEPHHLPAPQIRGYSDSINYFVDDSSQRYSSMYDTPRSRLETGRISLNQQRESSSTKIYPVSSDYYEPVDAYTQLDKMDGADCS
ncbi:multiple epidermal growth factor-like domains protein 10 [Saccostrea echinata]|uniref:multiple epidermal growth factor-like domains protein 10 n=1 Tax=Saccostrea echinata TaxID=191078 RepID=UPI002A828ED4|nr:multiple epidermal growth factor-like domains protein 10 [Saccostrea echinata]